jgi:transcriptional regulator
VTTLLMPLLAVRSAGGCPMSLLGHLPRRHAIVSALAGEPRAFFLFTGPHGYISPTWVRDRRWAPTWNFAQVRIEADVHFEPNRTGEALAELVEVMEAGRPDRWQIAELGDRYEQLATQVIAFRADIRVVAGRFKLGQDERPEILADILEHVTDPALADWMRRFNRHRL